MAQTSYPIRLPLTRTLLLLALAAGASVAPTLAQVSSEPVAEVPLLCERNLTANVVALDQVYFWNRLGAVQPHGMIFALRRDVVSIDPTEKPGPGRVMLREDKRPRPLVLRMNVGDCLTVNFTNWLSPTPVDEEQPHTRTASVHVVGMQLVNNIDDDGSFVGRNANSLAVPGETRRYTFYAEREGPFLLYSGGALTGGEGNNGSISAGLFGAVNVQPRGAEWYRSQVTRSDMDRATRGRTAQGHPILDYDATYPTGHAFSGVPIFNILRGTEIVHSDLTAIITGPNRGNFPLGSYPQVAVYPNRNKPFREFTIIFHDEIAAVQAFPQFEDPVLSHTTHSTRDAFAINYGTGGIGAEILANRLGVGPMYDCTECKYEEFFLTSWAVGDPAMVVDMPANAPCTVDDLRHGRACNPTPGPKATKAFYPDDPSNVYHSYLNDHVKFRNLLAGSDDHHIFHLHAHQWLHTPDSDTSTYLDSQAIGQGSGFTYEIAHDGSGNRNQTAGDSIFHCHFYPHFAQGMWSMWRVHDVFENGTVLDGAGRPIHDKDGVGNLVTHTRALPDAEILAGTPIPALVPLPTQAMAPMPQAQVSLLNGQAQVQLNGGNPGYPFWVPGVAGHRPPHPPLDTTFDAGLPRHVIVGGEAFHIETRLDFTKEIEVADAIELPENGTAVETAAMGFHAQRAHPSFRPDGAPAKFKANGLPAVAGAPFADPCIDDAGLPVGNRRVYKGADIQIDAVLNKKGWHFPQQRIISLWEDVQAFKFGSKPPEPLFFRANTDDCIEYQMTNLVPNIYELDDFQVRTPTDILSQHIHLVKFDVTSSDGGGNGFNYEDGTFSPDEVRERMHAIRAHNGCLGDEVTGGDPRDGTFACPVVQAHPFFGPGPDENNDGVPDWLGAQTTIQRWYADETLDLDGNDRTLRTVFTHDHFGPSTHQQGGLYAGLVVEPQGSTWLHNETGQVLGGRPDGGPTSWQAVIRTAGSSESYREFMFEFADFQLAYEPNQKVPAPYNHETGRLPGEGFDDPKAAINPPGRVEIDLPQDHLYEDPLFAGGCPGGVPVPCPELVSADDPGTYAANYRNEPLALRLRNPGTNTQAAGNAGDPSYSYASIPRADTDLNVQPPFYAPIAFDMRGTDPFTPLLRAYEDDDVQIRILVGAHEQEHNFTVHGVKWLFEPSDPNSGYRNSQFMGISEHYEFEIPSLPKNTTGGDSHDFLWKAGAASEGQWNGNWGLMRAYRSNQQDLVRLPNNPAGNVPTFGLGEFNGICPRTAPVRTVDVVAVAASQALPRGSLVYNSRPHVVTHPLTGATNAGPLHDPTALLFLRASDYDFTTGRIKSGVPIEPLILRARAGECIEVTLHNRLPGLAPDLDGYNAFDNIVDFFNANDVRPSSRVGLHPQGVFYDVTRSDGVNVGFNPEQTVAPGHSIRYQWYAGDVSYDPVTSTFVPRPIEFGATNLVSSDPLKHSNKGLIGALIVEPPGSKWAEDRNQRAAAWVKSEASGIFREFVLLWQSDINMRFGQGGVAETVLLQDGGAIPPLPDNEDPAERGQKALNYRAEPIWFRMGFAPETPFTTTRTFDFTNVLSNLQVGGDPETPLFVAKAGTPTRFRVLHPAGHGQGSVFELHGHIWEEEPYTSSSELLGTNTASQWKGSQPGHGPSNHFDAVLKHGAGSLFRVPGDYLYRDYVPWLFHHGNWGIFRVQPESLVVTTREEGCNPYEVSSACPTQETGVTTQ